MISGLRRLATTILGVDPVILYTDIRVGLSAEYQKKVGWDVRKHMKKYGGKATGPGDRRPTWK